MVTCLFHVFGLLFRSALTSRSKRNPWITAELGRTWEGWVCASL